MQFWIPRLLVTGLSLTLWLFSFPPAWLESWWGILPLSLYFLSFCAGLLGWGLWLEKRWGGGGAGVWLFSSVVAVAMAMLFGHVGWLGAEHRWLFLFVLHAGLLVAPWRDARMVGLPWRNPWVIGVLAFVFGLRYFTAYLPQAHGDPLLYHLMGPRLWNLMGVVQLNQDLPVPLLAATWEYFFLWPQVLFTSEPASMAQLVLAQLFSQWIHLLWGLFGSVMVLDQMVREKKGFAAEGPRLLLCLALLFVPSMAWTGPLAKNDCGMAFWCLGSWLFLWEGLHKPSKKAWLLGGLFAGLAVSAKISAVLFLIPLGMILLVRLFWFHPRAAIPALAFSAIGTLFGALPVYFRNWWETQNPFYTMFHHWFPGPWVSQSWANHFDTHQPSGGEAWYSMLFLRAHQLTAETPIFWLWILLPLLLLHKAARTQLREWTDWILLFVLALVVMVGAVMPTAEFRYLGASLWVGAAAAMAIALVFLQQYLPRWQTISMIILCGALLGVSKLPTHFLWKFFRVSPGVAYLQEHTGAEAKAWLREHAGNRLVVISGDNETYYLSTIRTTVLTEQPTIDKATYGLTDAVAFLKALCETSGASFLLDTRAAMGLHLRFPGYPWDKAILFEKAGARVYDLQQLQQLILRGDFGCGRS